MRFVADRTMWQVLACDSVVVAIEPVRVSGEKVFLCFLLRGEIFTVVIERRSACGNPGKDD